MRRFIAMLLSFALCLQMGSQLAVTAEASSEGESQKEICNTEWVDDFSTDTIANYKVAGPDTGAWGNWQVVDGKLQVTGNPIASWWGTSLLLKDTVYEDFVMEFDADVSAGYGVILRAQDDASTSGSGLNAWHSGDAYVIMHWAPIESNASVQILDFNGTSGGEVLANVGSVGAMTSAHWKIMAVGNDIVISITDNNDASNTITYTLNNSKYSSGMLGFYNLTAAGVTSLKVDNLSVTPMNSTLYEDDYSENSLDDYFVAGPDNGAWGNWQIADEKLQVTGNTGANWWGTSILTDEDYNDFVMEFDADVSAGYGVFLRAEDDAEVSGSGLNAWFGGNTYTIMHWAPVESNASVQILNYNGANNVIANVGSIGAMTSAHWKIVARGNTIYIKIMDKNNNANSISYVLTDNTYSAGHVGFYNLTSAGFTSLKVDNLTIKGYEVQEDVPVEKQEWDEDGTLKILTVGNSFSVDAQEFVYQIAENIGVEEIVLGNLYIGGCELSMHLDNARNNNNAYIYYTNRNGTWVETANYSIESAVKSENWDYITFQQRSTYSGIADTYDDLQDLINIVEPMCPKAKLVWHMTWADAEDSTHYGFINNNYTQETMYKAIVSAVMTKIETNESINSVIPCGTAIQNARTSYLGDTMCRDGHHLTYDVGRYIAGLTFVHALTGLSIDDTTYMPAGVSDEIRQIAIESAKNAVKNPYEVTQSAYTSKSEETEAEISWTDDMNSSKGDNYTSYGLWWNDAVSTMTGTDYTGVLGNEGGSVDGITYYYLNNYKFEDFVMEFDVVSTSEKAQYGVVLRAGNPGAEADQGNGYTIMYDGNWVFVGKIDGTFTQIKSATSSYAYNPSENGITITHWKVVCAGNTIAVYFNNSNVAAIYVTDDTYTSGSVGFRAFAPADTVKNVVIDNVSVKGTGTYTAPDDDTQKPGDNDTQKPDGSGTTDIKEPEVKISWTDNMSSNKGENYTAYGLWWNNAVSNITNTDYTGVLGNEGGSADGITYYYLNDYKFEDFVMEFDVVSTSAKAQYGVVLRAGEPGAGVDQADGYTVMYDGEWVFAGKLDGKFTQITSTPSAYAYNPSDNGVTITHWKVVCVGDTIAVYFNNSDVPAIQVTDATYKSGSVGFRAFAPANTVKNVVIDNVSVKGTGTYTAPTKEENSASNQTSTSTKLQTYDFEWKDEFDSDTFTSYLAYGRWWNNAISEFNGKDYSDVLANEGGIADGVCYYYLRKYKWTDFTMEFDVSSVDSTAQYGVVLRAGTYSDGADDCDGYTVMYDGEWIFVGKLNGKFVQVKNTANTYAYNPGDNGITPKHWKITCIGNTIQVYLNGSDTPIISVTDSDFNCGYVGFRTFAKEGQQTNVIFDNLHIKGTVLYEELTTTINSNRRSGKVSDYSTLSASAKKTNKAINDQTDTSNDKKDDASVNLENESGSSLQRILIPAAIVLLLAVVVAEIVIITKKKKR